ncbi:SIS domain-containing protein [Streptomyces sp. NBS 14/10]|uniref:SIS domain-containing protein n=1 Tax=Streptomyces sp. NBS 14/10 TaxID=1945643 RepID=UPI000B7CAC02|nr:SIS domain-containing protein [Streptomyces sp. NBS 14/10]KAK1183568.1 SIS domain-containing protein [Streptomyces sp. NBS 14/10]
MEPLDPEVMIRQVAQLPTDLRERTPLFDERVHALLPASSWTRIDHVFLTGDGDSHHASCAAEMAFETLARIPCEPISAHRFLHYGPLPTATPIGSGRQALLIATSASGTTKAVVEAIKHAKKQGALTVAITGTPDSSVTKVADRSLVVDLPNPERSPGIRTYQASLLGMLLTAIRLAENRAPACSADRLRREIRGLADAVEATAQAVRDRCRQVAAEIATAPVVTVVGSGPTYGTALFAAAKIIEASGVYAAGQDLEEWSHVERFAHPIDTPVVVIAPPGRSLARAAALATQAHGLGRRVIAVTASDDTAVSRHAHAVLPVHGTAREEFSPLLYHLFADYTACYLAQHLTRSPFQAG